MESNNERLSQSNTEFVENMRQQLMNAQMHITNLELGRTEDREVINEKEQQLADLKEQLAKLTIESDVLAAMKTQVCTALHKKCVLLILSIVFSLSYTRPTMIPFLLSRIR